MATLNIRNLDEQIKTRLRLRAAARNRSMEEEARQILRATLQEPTVPTSNLAFRVRARFAALGDVQLPFADREQMRPLPFGNEQSLDHPSRRQDRAMSPDGAALRAIADGCE